MTDITGSPRSLDRRTVDARALLEPSTPTFCQTGTQQQVADRRGRGSPDRTTLRHRSHGARLSTRHPAGRAKGAFPAHRRRVEAVVRETDLDDLERLDARRGRPLRAQSMAGTDALPR